VGRTNVVSRHVYFRSNAEKSHFPHQHFKADAVGHSTTDCPLDKVQAARDIAAKTQATLRRMRTGSAPAAANTAIR
jgi:hypothetical protein